MELEGARGPSGGWEVGPSEDRPLGLGEGQQGRLVSEVPQRPSGIPYRFEGQPDLSPGDRVGGLPGKASRVLS